MHTLFLGRQALLLILLTSCTAGTVAIDKPWAAWPHSGVEHETGVRLDSADTGETGDSTASDDTSQPEETADTDETGQPIDSGDTSDTSQPVETGDPGPDGAPCADGHAEGGPGWFGRDDVAFCASVDSSAIPSWDLGEVEGTCAAAWHVCLESEWDERNDACEPGLTRFSAVLDAEDVILDDNDCMAHDNAEIGGWSCASDYVDPANAGTCTGRTSTAEVGKRWMTSGFSSSTVHGVACCW